jgi:hypothetical protein
MSESVAVAPPTSSTPPASPSEENSASETATNPPQDLSPETPATIPAEKGTSDVDDAPASPKESAWFLSRVFFTWLGPFMELGRDVRNVNCRVRDALIFVPVRASPVLSCVFSCVS